MIQPREIALQILYDIEKHQAYLNISFQNHVEEAGLSARDAAFVKEICYGVMQWKLRLDNAISRFSSVKLKKLSPYVLSLLRMGLYQLFFMDKIPPNAAVNEAVKLAGRYAKQSKGFINAILRRAVREGEQLPEGSGDESLAVRYSHPVELVRFMRKHLGEEKTLRLLQENNQTPPLFVRVNTLKTTRADLITSLAEEGIETKEGMWSDSCLVWEGGAIQSLSAYQKGFFTVQDQSAQLAALALAPQPGERVFDMCAAPGGKTTHMAELMENQGEIVALDIYEKRLHSVTETAKRLGISIIRTEASDARQFEPAEPADKILIDAPCSGMGVIRRRPDLRYKEGLTDSNELTETQGAILEHCAGLLKDGGEMVYSTCTVNPAENEEVVVAFLERHKDFSLMPVENPHIVGLGAELLKNGMATFYPDMQGGDGFFIAKLKKESAQS
ncbi:MAG: 16S rRNA (cytosine(967)-C(5))-methyltransferase RsmB [Clostridia bacterium]|nr:16S rRNA (cytosine(967)-C(5))-methyltransferase RsmB [Clostridia bacterium]